MRLDLVSKEAQEVGEAVTSNLEDALKRCPAAALEILANGILAVEQDSGEAEARGCNFSTILVFSG